ncbi:MAG: 30S ribosomal protein S18 [Planctomycetota bacterium]
MFIRKDKNFLVKDLNYIDYKNVDLLSKLIVGNGKLTAQRQTGCDSRKQHQIKRAVHRARFMALLPYGQ